MKSEHLVAYPAYLRVDWLDDHYVVDLSDNQGNIALAEVRLDFERPLRATGSHKITWKSFLAEYREAKDPPSPGDLVYFGDDLFQWLIQGTALHKPWGAISQARSGRPLGLVVEFGENTLAFQGLPLELLRHGVSFVFNEPGASLQRTFRTIPAAMGRLPEQPRVLFVWAFPPGAGGVVDPTPHIDALNRVLGETSVTVLPNATLRQVQDAVSTKAYDVLHVLAHGFIDPSEGGVVLCDEAGAADLVPAQRLAEAARGGGLGLAFLCSCQTAVSLGLTGTGQHLLAPLGADLPWVVATQGNLAVRGSDRLVERFYELLRAFGNVERALGQARRDAWAQHDHMWSVPVLLARPEMRGPRSIQNASALPETPIWIPRAAVDKGLAALNRGRLVSIVGMPGIGKTEVGLAIGRRWEQAGHGVLWVDATTTPTVSDLKTQLGTKLMVQLNLPKPPENEESLVHHLATLGQLVLLVDNAEDLMRTDEGQGEFAGFLDLLSRAPHLHVLLTTRWPVDRTKTPEQTIPVEAMTPEETERLLRGKLVAKGKFAEVWVQRPAWKQLVTLLDGHPRSIDLISGQFGMTPDPARICERLERLKANAVDDVALVGRETVFKSLDELSKNRLRSLRATMELSYLTLKERYPTAAQLFLGLAHLPFGLPYDVALSVAQGNGAESVDLDRVLYWNLMEQRGGRCRFPVPLLWYAKAHADQTQVDAAAVRSRAVSGLAAFVRGCRKQWVGGDIRGGIQRFLPEVAGLEDLAENPPVMPTRGRSVWAALAADSHPLLAYAHIRDLDHKLLDHGLNDARDLRDHFGEANTLQSIGDLALRNDELGEARTAYDKALAVFRDIGDRLGEANTLQSIGDLALRNDELGEARTAYDKALAGFRDIGARLGEANTLQSIGDLALRNSELGEARTAYDKALAGFRDIGERLGEANTLQSIGLLLLAEGQPREAFVQYLAVLVIYQSLGSSLGVQAVVGYLARCASAIEEWDRAIVLAGVSLDIGRRIADRHGQGVNLGLMTQCFAHIEDWVGVVAAMVCQRDIAEQIGDTATFARTTAGLTQLRAAMKAEIMDSIAGDPQGALAFAIQQAQQRLEQRGVQLLDPL